MESTIFSSFSSFYYLLLHPSPSFYTIFFHPHPFSSFYYILLHPSSSILLILLYTSSSILIHPPHSILYSCIRLSQLIFNGIFVIQCFKVKLGKADNKLKTWEFENCSNLVTDLEPYSFIHSSCYSSFIHPFILLYILTYSSFTPVCFIFLAFRNQHCLTKHHNQH